MFSSILLPPLDLTTRPPAFICIYKTNHTSENPRLLFHPHRPDQPHLRQTNDSPERRHQSKPPDRSIYSAQLIHLQLLKTRNEIMANTFFRMLQLRGFIDGTTHTLTAWGCGLQAAMAALGRPELDESIYLGMELLALKVLHENNFAVGLSGAPSRGTGDPPIALRSLPFSRPRG